VAIYLLSAFAVAATLPAHAPTAYAAEAGASAGPLTAAQRDRRFGVNQAWEEGAIADSAGAGWSRLTFWWTAFQPNGPKDWNYFATDNDSYIKDELKRGRELAGVVLHTPPWASDSHSPNAVPKGLYLPYDHPQNLWGQFMKELAKKYAGRVDTWIIWNEVDIPDGQWRVWDGSMEDYVELLAVAYQAVKAGNPKARVAHYGSPWWYDKGAGLKNFFDILQQRPDAAANNYFFDIGNMHLYSRASDIPQVVPWYRDQLDLRGLPQKPIWIGETNVIPYDDPQWPASKAGFRASLDEQANYIVESFATYLAMGVERVGVNRLIDGQDFKNGGEPFGMLRNDLTPRPAFKAFQVVTRYFGGASPVSYEERNGLFRVELERPGERITVAWTIRPQDQALTVEGVAPGAVVVNKYGDTQQVWADEYGDFSVTLPGATANSNEADGRDYVVGGDPLILIERHDGAFASTFVI
jgi:hypothetical protein